MRPGSALLGGPPSGGSADQVVVACRDCHWWAVSDRVRLDCPNDWAHSRPEVVHAFVECTDGCWADWFDRYPQGCSAGHPIRITRVQFRN